MRLAGKPKSYGLVTLTAPRMWTIPLIFLSSWKPFLSSPLSFRYFCPYTLAPERVFKEQRIALHPAVHLIDPLGYLDFLWLMSNSLVVLTDSGGIQEETTALEHRAPRHC
jgi:UDP-N-acetylglucosamine 2-epimerase (non-hydrolysing)